MALRNLVLYDADEPFLRKKCREVSQIDQRVLQLLDDMAETMYANGGCGLAACQVGVLKRLVTIDMGNGLMKMVNPQIVAQEGQQEVVEGCLSLPGRSGKLLRPRRVTVRYLNEEGQQVEQTAEGDLAKCFCHEIDHLDGILYADKVIEWLK